MNKSLTFKSLLVGLSLLAACVHSPVWTNDANTQINDGPCDPNTVYFQNDILPILISSCSEQGCHDAGTRSDGVQTTSYVDLMNSDIVRAGDPSESKLWKSITDTDPGDRMPEGKPPLTNDQLDLIRRWIEQGAKNLICESACDTTKFTYTAVIAPTMQKYCVGCHSGGSPSAGIILDNHASIQTYALNGQLYGSVNHDPAYKAMPQGGQKLEACKVTQIRKWIENGALNN